MRQVIYLPLFLLSLFSQMMYSQGEEIFDDSYVHELRVTFEESDYWEGLTSDYQQNWPDVPYRMAAVTLDGVQIDSIGIRQKGFSSHFSIEGLKKSMKIDFNHFVKGQTYDGLKKINFNNGVGDPAMQRDKLSYDLMNRMGVPAPRTAYANVYLNDVYWGIYVMVEQVDRTFINQHAGSSNGNLFKNIGNSDLDWKGADSSAYQQIFELKTDNNGRAWTDFVHLMDVINNATSSEFEEAIVNVFDVERYLQVLVVDVATSNWDSYLQHGRNFYMYQDGETGKFEWIPWDYNFAMGGTFGPGGFGGGGPGGGNQDTIANPDQCATILDGSCPYPSTDSIFIEVINLDNFCCNDAWDDLCQQRYDALLDDTGGGDTTIISDVQLFPVDMSSSDKVLINRLMDVPTFRDRYYELFCGFLEIDFTSDRILPLIDQNGDLLREHIEADPNYIWTVSHFESDLENGSAEIVGLKQFVRSQSAALDADLEILFDCESIPTIAEMEVVINEFMADNDSLSGITDPAGQREDWIELYNNTNDDIDLTGAFLSDDRDNIEKWQFPIGTTIKAGAFLIIWADEDGGQQDLHANFKIAKGGETLILSDNGVVVDSLSFGEQESNMTYSRVPNGTGDFEIKAPTFGYDNESSAVKDELVAAIKIYPNPAHGSINITIEGSISATHRVTLTNSIGIQVKNTSIAGETATIDISDVVAGMYFCTIYSEDGKLTTRRISVL